MEELKPCPFCGGEAWQEVNSKKAWTRCAQCGATTAGFQDFHNTDGSIIDRRVMAAGAWNRRAAPENKPLTLEELRKMDGEPVWVVNPEMETAEWMLCDAKRQICIPVEGYFIEFSRYGIEWLAYAHRPEGSETK